LPFFAERHSDCSTIASEALLANELDCSRLRGWVRVVRAVQLADGSLGCAEIASFERAALPWTDNAPIASPICDLTVRVLETLATA
jgi:hypothetical protein